MKISCNQYQSSEKGIVVNNNGQILSKTFTTCGTLFVDYASDFIFNFTQTSTNASQTVEGKHKFETYAKSCSISIQHYHADNKIFTSQQFKESCITAQQIQSYCSVNAHHQNRVAEWKIKTMISLAQAMLFNVIIKWPNIINVGFWPYAVHYAVDILNNTPNSSGFTPREIFTGSQTDRSLKNFHTFRLPAYVLDPTIQQGKKLPI